MERVNNLFTQMIYRFAITKYRKVDHTRNWFDTICIVLSFIKRKKNYLCRKCEIINIIIKFLTLLSVVKLYEMIQCWMCATLSRFKVSKMLANCWNEEKQWKINSVHSHSALGFGVSANAHDSCHYKTTKEVSQWDRVRPNEYAYLHGTVRSMNDKYWNMLYDREQQLLRARTLCYTLTALSWTQVKTISFSLLSTAISMMWIFVEFAVFFSASFLAQQKLLARGSFNSSSSEAVNQVQCVAYNEKNMHKVAILQQQRPQQKRR